MKKSAIKILALILAVTGAVELHAQTGIINGADTSRRVITTAVPFLLITPDARAGAMGDAGVATTADANSIHWNVAKLAFVEQDLGFSLSVSPWLSSIIDDMSISYLSGYKKITKEQVVGVDLRYFNLGNIQLTDNQGNPFGEFSPREFSIGGAYSRLLTNKLSLGVAARFIHSNLSGNFTSPGNDGKNGTSVAVDFGVFWKKDLMFLGRNSNLALGAHLSNIGRKITYSNDDNNDFLPANLRFGGALTTSLDPYNTLTFALDFNKLLVPTPPVYEVASDGSIVVDSNGNPVIARGEDPNRSLLAGTFGSFFDAPDGFSEELQEISISTGLEYWYKDIFAARVGYFYESANKGNRKYFTGGIGFRYQRFGIDFAYLLPQEQNHPLADTLRFSLQFNMDGSGGDESVTE